MKTIVITTLLAAFGAAMASGADVVVKAQIPFPFTAHGKVLPAGVYEVSIDYQTEFVTLRSDTKGVAPLAMPFLTTLAKPAHTTATDADLIFDKVGDRYTLSEVWTVDNPGILIYATKGKHEHHIIHSTHDTSRSAS